MGDGPLGRWPAHFLPLGDALLGDGGPVSSLPSISALVALRDVRSVPNATSGLIGMGAPQLYPLNCARAEATGLASLSANVPNRDVLCLGQVPGARSMLSRLSEHFTPSKVIAGRAATLDAVRQMDFSSAGTVIFGTHGLIGHGGVQDILRLRMDRVGLGDDRRVQFRGP